MSKVPEPIDPFHAAIVKVLPPEFREEFDGIVADCREQLTEALERKGRAAEWIHTGKFQRPFEHLEAELETEHAELVMYHLRKMTKRVAWLLESWKDTPEEE